MPVECTAKTNWPSHWLSRLQTACQQLSGSSIAWLPWGYGSIVDLCRRCANPNQTFKDPSPSLPVEAQFGLPGETLEMTGHPLLQAFQAFAACALHAQAQAIRLGLQQGQAAAELDTALLLIETHRDLVGEVFAQPADIAGRCIRGDIGAGVQLHGFLLSWGRPNNRR